jgi:hypothetical protein
MSKARDHFTSTVAKDVITPDVVTVHANQEWVLLTKSSGITTLQVFRSSPTKGSA